MGNLEQQVDLIVGGQFIGEESGALYTSRQ